MYRAGLVFQVSFGSRFECSDEDGAAGGLGHAAKSSCFQVAGPLVRCFVEMFCFVFFFYFLFF